MYPAVLSRSSCRRRISPRLIHKDYDKFGKLVKEFDIKSN